MFLILIAAFTSRSSSNPQAWQLCQRSAMVLGTRVPQDEVKKYYWKSVLWNESYFIASCGAVTVSILKKYIEQQDTPEDCPSAGH